MSKKYKIRFYYLKSYEEFINEYYEHEQMNYSFLRW